MAARDAQRVFKEWIDVDRHIEARVGFEVVMPPTFFADSLRRAVAAHGPIESALSCAREIEALNVIRTKNKTEFAFAAHDSVSDAVHESERGFAAVMAHPFGLGFCAECIAD